MPWGNAVIGIRNPVAPPLAIERDADGSVFTDFHLGAAYEGPPGHVHGGIAALVLDHVLGEAASSTAEKPRLTGTITLRYLRTTRLGLARRGDDRADRGGEDLRRRAISPTTRASPSKPKACSSDRSGPATELLPRHRQVEPFLGRDEVVVAVLADVELNPLDLAGEAVAGRPVVR